MFVVLGNQTRAALPREIRPKPLALDSQPILQLRQSHQVNKHPREPSDKSTYAKPAGLQHGKVLADHCDCSLVKISKRTFGLPPFELSGNQPSHEPSLLDCRLRNARHGSAVLHDSCRVTDDEYGWPIGNIQKRTNRYPARSIGLGAEHFHEWRCRHPRSPQYGSAWNVFPAGDHALAIDTVNLDPSFDVDTEFLQPSGRLFRQALGEGRQNAVTGLDKND